MYPNKYTPPRVKSGDLRTQVTFFEYKPKEGPLPGENEKQLLFETWAKVDQVWLKDLELAKSNGTLSDITITIRDPLFEYKPTNLHYLEVDASDYQGYRYNIKKVQPNLQDRRFIDIVAGLVK
ncbi:phage head-tail adapter protein [Alkalihalobacillus sp. FSL R5-0424]